MGYRVAVVGATGAVGREMLKTLAERGFPVGEAVGLAAPRAVGAEVSFGEKTVLKMRNIETFDFKGTDLVLFAGGQAIAAAHAPRAAAAGCMVIDDSGRFRMEFDVPLVVPEVNPQALKRAAKRRIVASPTGPTIPLAVALKPLHDIARVKRVVASTYQAVSGVGKEGMDELFNQTKGSFVNDQPTVEHFPKPIAFNCIPQVDAVQEDGTTREEWAMALEIRKILDPDVLLVATCVRVPVFIGNGVSVLAEFHDAIGVEAAWEALREAPGIQLVDKREDGGYVTPLESVGEDAVFVSRMRADPTVPHGLAFWCVVDNLRKGSALNAVQIAEVLEQQGMIGGRPALA